MIREITGRTLGHWCLPSVCPWPAYKYQQFDIKISHLMKSIKGMRLMMGFKRKLVQKLIKYFENLKKKRSFSRYLSGVFVMNSWYLYTPQSTHYTLRICGLDVSTLFDTKKSNLIKSIKEMRLMVGFRKALSKTLSIVNC